MAIEPVAVDEVAVGIEAAEEGIRQGRLPHVVLDLHPVGDDLGALDLDPLALGGLVDDAPGIRFAAARRVHPLAIGALMDGDHIARLGDLGGGGDRLERLGCEALVRIVSVDGDMEFFGGGEGRR